jgi:hypothetical protein
MKIYSVASVFAASIMTVLIVQVAVTSSGLTPWQLFRSLCPYFSNQSPQCAIQQQQQPFPSTTVPSTTVPSTSPQVISPQLPPTTSIPPTP